MDVRWLTSITGVKEKSVRSASKYGRHPPMLWLPSLEDNAITKRLCTPRNPPLKLRFRSRQSFFAQELLLQVAEAVNLHVTAAPLQRIDAGRLQRLASR